MACEFADAANDFSDGRTAAPSYCGECPQWAVLNALPEPNRLDAALPAMTVKSPFLLWLQMRNAARRTEKFICRNVELMAPTPDACGRHSPLIAKPCFGSVPSPFLVPCIIAVAGS